MRRWGIATCVATLAIAADALLWRVGVWKLDTGLDRWIADARVHGWTVSAGARTQGGWPLAASLTVADVHLAGGSQLMPGGLAWSSGYLVLKVALTDPATLAIDAGGPQRLRLSHAPEMVLSATRLSADIPLRRHAVSGLLRAEGLSGGILGSGHPGDVQVADLSLRLSDNGGDERSSGHQSARLDINAHGVGLPDIGRWPLGGFVSEIGGVILLTALPGKEVDPEGVTPEDQARAWRDGGGRLDVQDLHLHWGPLRLKAQAALGLDSRLQPEGTGRADVAGSSAALDALAGGGVIPPGLAATAKAVLAVMPAAPDQDGLRLPFVLRDSTLSVGQIPVVRLNDVAWRRHRPT